MAITFEGDDKPMGPYLRSSKEEDIVEYLRNAVNSPPDPAALKSLELLCKLKGYKGFRQPTDKAAGNDRPMDPVEQIMREISQMYPKGGLSDVRTAN